MGDSIAERMDAGWQAARHWETECEAARNQLAAVTSERDAHLATIRGTFRVLESRGQAPDDNAPLQVTVRRVLDFLDTVTSERDALAAQLAAMKKRVSDAPRITVFEMNGELCHSSPEPRDWRTIPNPIEHGDIVAWLRLEDGET